MIIISRLLFICRCDDFELSLVYNTHQFCKSMKIAIIGAGVVGKATGFGFTALHINTTFFDTKYSVINNLNTQGFVAHHVSEIIHFKDTYDLIFISVPTPTNRVGINLRYIFSAAKYIAEYIKRSEKYCCIIIRSTIIPGSTREKIIPFIQNISGKQAGIDFGICMNPEYLRANTANSDFINPKAIVFGSYDRKSEACLEKIYKKIKCPIYKITLEEAEFQKYVHNIYNASKISFFNEMRYIGDSLSINTEKIFAITTVTSEASWNKDYGIRNLGPFQGNCLPKDIKAFYTWAKSRLLTTYIMKAIIQSNNKFIRLKLPSL